jgi:hypothetical protein
MNNCHRCKRIKELIKMWDVKCVILEDQIPDKTFKYPIVYLDKKRITYTKLIEIIGKKANEIKRLRNERKKY